MDGRPTHDKHPARETSPDAPAGTLDTADLFAGRTEVRIRHGRETYRLRVTRNGGLILNK